MLSTTMNHQLLLVRGAVLRTLAYFDIFDHPLTQDELLRFADIQEPGERTLERVLHELKASGIIEEYAGYWAMKDCLHRVRLREISEERARVRFPKAERMARRIARFPFVRAVFISGSMSKGCLSADGDIDYFIITTPGRLWVARTLLILYKKFFLLNSRRDFCVNYFLDTEHLTVEDRNRFTAMELVTLLPLYGNGTTEAFFDRNAWAFALFPATPQPRSREIGIGQARFKSTLERLLSGRLGDLLDEQAMGYTWRYWKWKFSHMDPRSFDLALRTRTYVSKHHPRNFQQRVLDGFHHRMIVLEKQLGQALL
jgi:hypothetical protein